MTEAEDDIRKRIAELRRHGDAEWERGNKKVGARLHEQARLLTAAWEGAQRDVQNITDRERRIFDANDELRRRVDGAEPATSSDDVIRSGPHSGKTTRLVRKSAQGGYIVCSTRQEAYRIAQAAAEMKVSIPFPLTFDELLQGQLDGMRCSPLHIDNADTLLRYLCARVGATLGTITLSE